MNNLTLKATTRKVLGKKSKFLRRNGLTPTHLFGHDMESLTLQCNTAQLQRIISNAGTTRLIKLEIEGEQQPRSIFIREVQADAISRQLVHVDFYQVKEGERIESEIPLILLGEAQAIKGKNKILTHGTGTLHIESLPGDVPPYIEVDLKLLENGPIHVKDIKLPAGIIVKTDPDQLVAKLSEIKKYEEEVKPVVAVEAPTAEAAAAEQPEGQEAAKPEGKQEKAAKSEGK